MLTAQTGHQRGDHRKLEIGQRSLAWRRAIRSLDSFHIHLTLSLFESNLDATEFAVKIKETRTPIFLFLRICREKRSLNSPGEKRKALLGAARLYQLDLSKPTRFESVCELSLSRSCRKPRRVGSERTRIRL